MIDDKFQQHYRQQMSALMDGELAPDQARFLMKRMAEDDALADTWERWQLCGDVLRGQAQAPAPGGFAERVAAAVAAQPVQPAANQAPRRTGRVLRWGGGAIAAAVALVAVFMAGQQSGRPPAASPAPAMAAAGAPGAVAPATASPAGAAPALAASAVAVASLPRRADDSRRGSATRNQQAARATAAITLQALAAVNAPVPATAPVTQDPFAGAHLGQPAARPWPRSSLSQLRGSGAYAAGYAPGEQAPYYPFQPRLPVAEPVAPAQPAQP